MNTENGKSQRVETQTHRAGEKERKQHKTDIEDIQKEMQDKEQKQPEGRSESEGETSRQQGEGMMNKRVRTEKREIGRTRNQQKAHSI